MIGLVHNVPSPGGEGASEASADVLTQVQEIEDALRELNLAWVRLPLTKDLESFLAELRKAEVKVAFNLCETIDEDPRFVGFAPSLLELLGISFTGSPSTALMLTTDKILTKQLLESRGICTPAYCIYRDSSSLEVGALRFPVIIKPIFEDASIGIEQDSIITGPRDLLERIEDYFKRFGPFFVEEYVGGREVNVSLFGYPTPRVLPIAEIDFSSFPEDLYRIVSYKGKWDRLSFEYHHTPRIFPTDLPAALAREIETIAGECFKLFHLRDYGRVDMRIDDSGQVQVLEVNANPCLSRDAGFCGAVEKSGMRYFEMVEK
ncbi:MAG: D-alanine--D-alanine ligase, partial [Deltaproteobacteria bacterium]|nr:D-alanine--D-alanine ligase [Deltaproteobacteria bacterium]